MESVNLQTIIPPLLEAEARHRPQNVDVEACVICDHEGGHYQIVYLGWDGDRRIYSVLVHLRIMDDKVYIERDGTADGFADTLIGAGITRDRIVLAFHPPYKRSLTEFAAA